MAELFSQYSSGLQFTAGTIAGSSYGVSGLNPIVDRLNSITSSDGIISGTKFIPIHGSVYDYNGVDLTSGAGQLIVGPNSNRKSLLIYNNSDDSVQIGPSGLTYENSYELTASDTLQLTDTGSVYGMTLSGTLNVRWLDIS